MVGLPMSILIGKPFYTFSKVCSVLTVPGLTVFLIFFKVERKIISRGMVESRRQVLLRSPVKDTIVKTIHKKSGEMVKKNELIIEFLDIAGYENKAAQIRVQIRSLQKKLDQHRFLGKGGGVAQSEIEALEYKAQEMNLQLKDLMDKHQLYSIRAPFDGKLIKVYIGPYEKANIGTELCTLSAEDDKIIKCMVPEKSYSYLKCNQRVKIKSQMYNYLKYAIYSGVLEEISLFGKLENNDVYYEAIIGIDEGREKLKINSLAACEIVVGRQSLFSFIFDR